MKNMCKFSLIVLVVNCVLNITTANGASRAVNNSKANKVVGQMAEIEDFPFVVSLFRVICQGNEIPISSPCTGSIISNQWILTAAHCFPALQNGDNQNASSLYISAGSSLRDEGHLLETERVYTYPRYKVLPQNPKPTEAAILKNRAADIKLIKLKNKIIFTKKIAPVVLAENNNLRLNDPITVIGWSNLGGIYGNFSSATGQIVSLSEGGAPLIKIVHLLRPNPRMSTTAARTAETSPPETGSYRGDSGGPWLSGNKLLGQKTDWRQVGVLSGGFFPNPLLTYSYIPFYLSPIITPENDIYKWILETTGLRKATVEEQKIGSKLIYSLDTRSTPFEGHTRVEAEIWENKPGRYPTKLQTSLKDGVVSISLADDLYQKNNGLSGYKLRFKFYYGGNYYNSIEKVLVTAGRK